MAFRKPDKLRIDDDVVERLQIFREQVDVYFLLNNTWAKRRETQVTRLLNLLDEDALSIYYSMPVSRRYSPTVHEILDAFEEYFSPDKNTTSHIVNFFNRIQYAYENIDDYLEALKLLLPACQFGVQGNKILAAQIIRGLFNKRLQEELLEDDWTLEDLIDYCRNYELAEVEESTVFSSEESEEEDVPSQKFVLIRTSEPSKEQRKCSKCKENHPYRQCPAFNKKCFNCHKLGHFAKCCRDRVDLTDENEGDEVLSCFGIITVGSDDTEFLEDIEASLSGVGGKKVPKFIVKRNPAALETTKSTVKSSQEEMCGVCLLKPQNGLFIHHNISHMYGCYDCAKKIYRTSGNCPICRRSILKVSKLFMS